MISYGLTAGRDQSSSKDEPKKITKEGNAFVRRLLVSAANLIMQGRSRNTELQQFGLRVWGNRGKIAKRKAKVALARKLAVTMAAICAAEHLTTESQRRMRMKMPMHDARRPVLIPRAPLVGARGRTGSPPR